MAISTIGTNSLSDPIAVNGYTPTASNMQPYNRIINGAMTIAQRGAAGGTSAFVNWVDQFNTGRIGATGSSEAQSTDAPAGFKNSLLITVTATNPTPTTTDYFEVRNIIEGNNVYDFSFGSASAKTITLSFWVKSSIAGLYGGSLNNATFNYCCPYSYTINSANTWEFKTVTITGAPAGTWNTDTSAGYYVLWSLGLGSEYLGTAGAWTASRKQGVTGQTQMWATNGATFYLTGVQLEVGSTASPFAHENVADTLQKCQRYYEKSYDINTVPGTNTFSGAIRWRSASSSVEAPLRFTQTKRATPTVTPYSIIGPSGNILNVSTGINATASVATIGQSGCFPAKDTGGSDGDQYGFHYTASAEL